MWGQLIGGLTTLGSLSAVAYLFIGAVVGMIVGVIPGLGTPVVLTIVLAFVYKIDLTGTLAIFLGTYAGSYYSASVTSILLNTPAHPEAFAITFDGYPMARNGQPGRALGLSAAATCLGGIVGCAVLVGFIQIIDQLPGVFHPPEYLALVLLALLLVGTLGTDSLSKAVISVGIGLLVASIGQSLETGEFRYTFGQVSLNSGVSLIALFLGCFAIPQMVMTFGTGTTTAREDMTGHEVDYAAPVSLGGGAPREVAGGIFETFRHWPTVLQGGLTGALTGIIPGIGGFAANFLSYGIGRQMSGKRDQFGTGLPEGIIAPEGSSLSKEAGTMVPILGLGIPGSVGGALLIAALAIKGLPTGPEFTTANPTVTYEIVWVILLAGIIGTALGVALGPFLAKVTRVPGPLIVPFILALAVVSPFVSSVSFFDVGEVMVFALIGFALRRLRYSLAAFAVGLVLGPTLENNIYLTHSIYPGVSFLGSRWLADVLLFLSLLVVVAKAVEVVRRRRARRIDELEELSGITDPAGRLDVVQRQRLQRAGIHPLLELEVTVGLLGIALFAGIYAEQNFKFATAIMPVTGALLVAVATLAALPGTVRNYIFYRKSRNAAVTTLGPASAAAPGPPSIGPPAPAPPAGPAATGTVTAFEPVATVGTVVDDGPRQASPAGRFPPIKERAWGINGEYTREVVGFAWLAALLAGCYLIGFIWAIPLFMAVYGLVCTRRFLRSWPGRVAFATLSAVAMWLITYEMFSQLALTYTPLISL
jgi:putative tricarboxylic transport membrane protein